MDNAPAHTADRTLNLLQQLGWSRLPHPAYSPDLAPSDFWLFERLKKNLRGRHYGTLANLKDAVAEEITLIPSQEYQRCMLQSWPKRWRKCIQHHGDYFEGLAWKDLILTELCLYSVLCCDRHPQCFCYCCC